MIRPKLTSESTALEAVDLTSLIDVLFILLVFLILAMGTPLSFTEIKLPSSSQTAQKATQQNPESSIRILQGGNLRFQGKDFTQTHDFKIYFRSVALPTGQALSIAPDKAGPIGVLVEVMEFLGAEGYQKIEVLQEWKSSPKGPQ